MKAFPTLADIPSGSKIARIILRVLAAYTTCSSLAKLMLPICWMVKESSMALCASIVDYQPASMSRHNFPEWLSLLG